MIIKIEGMHCAHCAAAVEKALGGIGLNADVDPEKGEAVAEGKADADDIIAAVARKGFKVVRIDMGSGGDGAIAP